MEGFRTMLAFGPGCRLRATGPYHDVDVKRWIMKNVSPFELVQIGGSKSGFEFDYTNRFQRASRRSESWSRRSSSVTTGWSSGIWLNTSLTLTSWVTGVGIVSAQAQR